MTIGLRDDVAYIVLKKIKESSQNQKDAQVNLNLTDFSEQEVTKKELLDNLDYLNEKAYIKAQVGGNPEDANSPSPIILEQATLTEKGRQTLKKMESHSPADGFGRPGSPIATENVGFLEKVMLEANLNDIFDARDLTVVVYRVMRDVMTTEAADRVAAELHSEAQPTADKTLQMEVADLWKDTNPFVGFISRIRQPLIIKDDRFLFRIAQEGSMPEFTDAERVVKAVFSATKEQLSSERIAEISQWLPGKVKQLWNQA
ncbi:DUF2267 domain-containing protein [Laspinema olomoucense]|uniref:DUF2267 domain-containing protein n=1 Tax=Laspinema olomoucense TaxID=3231600 RepID=UPI0021BB8F82|nr:DUF2267 domain-containing protein [Laspinema sp. D3d]MCT7971893.1 DUF2267 domain-containing protein [Laspinema sp. D3d]